MFLIATHGSRVDFTTILILAVIMTFGFFITYGTQNMLNIHNIFFYLVFVVIDIVQVRIHMKHNIKFYNGIQIREKRKLEQGFLVGQLLPPHAIEKLFSDVGKYEVGDKFEDVTILYADIKGFTDYSASVEPKDVVRMLSALFYRFDRSCVQYNCYKVYTIGDCYVVLGFIDANNRDPGKEAHNVVKLAFSFIEIIREVRKEIKFEGLDMRIGIHTGDIIGGIVGTEIVRYDVWGQDVLIANAMESEGEKGNINVSETTKMVLERACPEVYKFRPHKTVNMEKIGAKVPCYLINSNDGYDM